MSLFKKAVKSESKLRLAITGPSGSGKTYTSLAIATALADGGDVAVIDTEHGSASKYADMYGFDVAEMHAPFSPEKYIAAINEAASTGYKVIVLDSLTHAWSGTGGLLDIVDEAAKRSQSKNTYTAWKEGTPLHNRLIDAIIQAPIHVIATMRSKAEYVIEQNERGKSAPRKVGMAPIQRDGMEYEFDILFQMTLDNDAIVEKTRCSALAGRVLQKPGADVAIIIKDWLSGTKPEPAKTVVQEAAEVVALVASVNATVTKEDPALTNARKAFHAQVTATFSKDDADPARHWFIETWCNAYTKNSIRTSTNDMTVEELDKMTTALKTRTKHYRDLWLVAKTAPIPAEKSAQPVAA